MTLSRVVMRWLFAICLAVVTYLFLSSMPAGVPRFPHIDKVFHFGSFFVLSALLYRAFVVPQWLAALLLLTYGLLIEFLQLYTFDRTADFYDWLTDAAGIAAYLFVHGVIERRQQAS
ncbi:VanZ family protein [Idiomarina tyrosinivorans]|uniref:VanZ family protein n=1 Tax=Idiomarina tyrosinivorans TaxID=1445662 RepID=UPI00130075A6|nr:VanZ family protein [Idiomarina tyrosinivorans]